VCAWVRPMPRWCRRLPWRRVSFAELVDDIVADAEVFGGGVGWAGFGPGLVGLRWCGAWGRARWVRSVL
jgi:hypothetical protein